MLCVVFFLLVCSIQKSSSVDHLEKLRDYLFVQGKYNKYVRPEQSTDSNTTVIVDFHPRYLIDYDEEKALLTLDALLWMEWNDTKLKWDPQNFGGHTQMHFDSGTIWQPRIAVYNSHSSNLDPTANTQTLVTSSGRVYWIPPATVTSYCHMEDLHLYPRDTQQCGITLGSWVEHGFQLDFQTKDDSRGLEFSRFKNSNPSWVLLQERSNISRKENYYDCCPEPYITVNIDFYLQRRYPSHLTVVWIPCILVMVLTLSIFWIPLFSGKKIALGGFLLLVLTILMVYVAAYTKPPAAQTYAVSFIRMTMCALTAAILLEILVMNMASIGYPYRPPGFLISILSSSVSKWFLVWSPLQPTESMDQIHLKDSETDKVVTPSFRHEWIMLATAFDRILFVIFFVVFLVIH